MRVILCIIGLALIQLSCGCEEKQAEDAISINTPERDIAELKQEALNGNVDSYRILKKHYLDYPSGEFLFYAIVFANKYKDPHACLDVFMAIVDGCVGRVENFHMIDYENRLMALKYLRLAASLGNKEAIEILSGLKSY